MRTAGNLRIEEAVAVRDLAQKVPTAEGDLVCMRDHPGFSRQDVVERSAAFVEYAFQHGIYAAGAFLRNEAAYMSLAKAVGPGVFAPLAWENDNLFVPRFDRVVCALAPHQRLGLESLYSLAGVADYGARTSHDELCAALLAYSSSPAEDLLEYIKRGALNVVLGNKDNHGRNTAVLKDETGRVRLSPLFDFAPMYLDPEGIARVCRWQGEAETAGVPDWAALVSRYHRYLGDHVDDLRAFGKTLQGLPDIARRVGVDEDIVEYHRRAIDNQARQLMAL